MLVAISGASGKTGFRIAEEALSKGYSVRLLVRKNSLIPETLKKCKRFNISLFNSNEIDNALEGCDSLFIATGARPSIDITGPAKIDALAVRNQVNSCKRVGVNRIILVSSLCSGKWFHPLNLFGLILIWKRIGENALEKSNLDWTIIRPGGLNENENEKDLNSQGIIYTSQYKQEEGSIPRRLVAKCCLESLETKNSIKRIIEITSSKEQPKISLNQAIKSII